MPADPEPKDARTAGAQARSRLVPNSARTAAVSTTTAELRGSRESGPSTSRSRAGSPRASSAAHITRSQDTVTPRLTCWATQAAACPRIAASWRAGAALGGLPARVPVKCLTATTVSDPMTRAGITISAASPAPSQLADSGSASGVTPGAASGDLPAVPIHSVTSSSVRGPALAARGRSCAASAEPARPPRASGRLVPPGPLPLRTDGVVTSPPAGLSWSRAAATERSAVVVQRKTGATGEPDGDVAARASPRKRCGSSLSPPLSAMPVNPPAGRMPDDANRTV